MTHPVHESQTLALLSEVRTLERLAAERQGQAFRIGNELARLRKHLEAMPEDEGLRDQAEILIARANVRLGGAA